MRWLARFLPAVVLASAVSAASFPANRPASTNNDDTCDISLLPAATLLLPYFEVDINSSPGQGETTIFTITNTYELPQVARVTLWTDYSYPVVTFNIYLTGYDVQSINLYDVIARGRISPDRGTGSDVSPVGELSGDFERQIEHDNPLVDEGSCINLAVQLPSVFIARMSQAFVLGRIPAFGGLPECTNAGGVHQNAVGYATVDVVGNCAGRVPTDNQYFSNDLRFDNVLVGDYQQINGAEDYAQVNPMVHIRAIGEGGTPAEGMPTNLPRTFYSRLLPAAANTIDRRQPLPSIFAARWIDGGPTGFETHFKIWREAKTPPDAACSAHVRQNGAMTIHEEVTFDEDENPETIAPSSDVFTFPMLPSTSRTRSNDPTVWPPNTQEAVAGWLYVNLDEHPYPVPPDAIGRQAWVVVSMRAENRFSGDMDAQALGNGCSGPIPASNANNYLGKPIGPAPNTTP